MSTTTKKITRSCIVSFELNHKGGAAQGARTAMTMRGDSLFIWQSMLASMSVGGAKGLGRLAAPDLICDGGCTCDTAQVNCNYYPCPVIVALIDMSCLHWGVESL